ncbi:MAG: hypothetical protein HZB16_02695 [Armatimonadetes bacterium]|nr:hypothetical protein [Armatimonadota bacterium]
MPGPSLRLVATADRVTPDDPLPVAVAVVNSTGQPLHGLSAELTLEIEKGVLLSWELILADVPAGGQLDQAMLDARPAYRLPHNAAVGQGMFRARLYASDGAQLAEAELQLPVTGSASPS